MTLKGRLDEDMKAAMKAREEGKERLSVIRMTKAAIKNVEIDKRHELSDEEVVEVISREVKQRRDALAEFGAKAGPEYTRKMEGEIAILMDYLPQQMSEEEVRRVCAETIAEVGAQDPKEIGKVMAKLMPKVKGRVGGKLVNQIVKDLLSK